MFSEDDGTRTRNIRIDSRLFGLRHIAATKYLHGTSARMMAAPKRLNLHDYRSFCVVFNRFCTVLYRAGVGRRITTRIGEDQFLGHGLLGAESCFIKDLMKWLRAAQGEC
jgi:hypothetical protein